MKTSHAIPLINFWLLWIVTTTTTIVKIKAASSRICNEEQSNECTLLNTIGETLLTNIDDDTTTGSSGSASVLSIDGTASLIPSKTGGGDGGNYEFKSNLTIKKSETIDCPSLENADKLSQSELIARLTASCRYDRMERPLGATLKDSTQPVQIKARAYIFVLQNIANSVQFNMQALLHLSYVDPRLAFESIAPGRRRPIQGEAELRNLIWVPHLFFANEQDSSVLGTFEKDIITTIAPNGTVVLATRIQATLFCWLQMKKFPFDEQYCTTTLESWMYNATDLILTWEDDDPVNFNPNMQFTSYALDRSWCNETLVNAPEKSLWHGGFNGNYSSISFTVHLVHSAGYYVMDYFIPSMIMVAISWVSFWIRADQTPSRTILNCSTMLSLITLASSQLKSSSSFITILEIWFLGCCIFIFLSLIEFAFSNTIYRRTQNVELKKVNSKAILKSTVKPRKPRPKSMNDSIDCIQFTAQPSVIESSYSLNSMETLKTVPSSSSITFSIDNQINDIPSQVPPEQTFATMTPQEISLWLDRKSRFIFPVAFIIFNTFFWTFVLIL